MTAKKLPEDHEKSGPKAKYKEWITPHGLTLITGWARNGLTSQQIAKDKLHISPTTLCTWQRDHPEIDRALKSGREVADLSIENALYNNAIRGNITAIIFYLKNRKPKEWRDNHLTDEELSRAEIEKARSAVALEKEQLELKLMRSMSGEDTGNAYAQIMSIVDMIRNPVANRTIDEILAAAEQEEVKIP